MDIDYRTDDQTGPATDPMWTVTIPGLADQHLAGSGIFTEDGDDFDQYVADTFTHASVARRGRGYTRTLTIYPDAESEAVVMWLQMMVFAYPWDEANRDTPSEAAAMRKVRDQLAAIPTYMGGGPFGLMRYATYMKRRNA